MSVCACASVSVSCVYAYVFVCGGVIATHTHTHSQRVALVCTQSIPTYLKKSKMYPPESPVCVGEYSPVCVCECIRVKRDLDRYAEHFSRYLCTFIHAHDSAGPYADIGIFCRCIGIFCRCIGTT